MFQQHYSMQIGGLSQCFSLKKPVKLRVKCHDFDIMPSIATGYGYRSFLAYLRPTLSLIVYTRVMRGTL